MYLDLEKFDQSIEDCELAIKLNPEGPKAYYRKGLALRELQQLPASAEALQKGLGIEANEEMQ